MNENWLDDVFGTSTYDFDFSKYSTETIIKTFKLNESPIVTMIKGTFKLFSALFALLICAFLIYEFFQPIEYPTIPSNTIVQEDTVKKDTIDKPNVEENKEDEENVEIPEENFHEENDSETPEKNNFCETIFNILKNIFRVLINSIDKDKIDSILAGVGAIITNPNSEEAQEFLNDYKQLIIDEVSNCSMISDNTKTIIVDYIQQKELDPVDINHKFTNGINCVLNSLEKIKEVLNIISEKEQNQPISTEEIYGLVDSVFE